MRCFFPDKSIKRHITKVRFYETYRLCASHNSMQTPAICNCTLSKCLKYHFYFLRNCHGNAASTSSAHRGRSSSTCAQCVACWFSIVMRLNILPCLFFCTCPCRTGARAHSKAKKGYNIKKKRRRASPSVEDDVSKGTLCTGRFTDL